MFQHIEYDKTNPKSIEKYAQLLLGKTFQEVIDEDVAYTEGVVREKSQYGEDKSKRNKGNIGQIIEERFFHYACNSDSRADFSEAGVEMRGDYFENGRNTGKLICGTYEISCAWSRRLSAENQKRIRAKI